MPTQAQITEYSDRIFNAARQGTPTNPQGLPVILAALLVAQARHETGNFTSSHFHNSNNAFGYSYVPGGTWQAGPGAIADNGQPVAKYASIEHSAKEIVDWIYRRVNKGIFPRDLGTIVTPEQYGTLLAAADYYTDDPANYIRGLVRYFQDIPVYATFGMLLLTALVLFLLYKVMNKK